MSAAAQIQEAEPIVVWVGRDSQAATFVLHPWTRRYLEREFPDAQRWPQVSIHRANARDFEELSDALQTHALALLTGLDVQQLVALGGEVRFTNPVNEQTLAVWSRDRR